MNLQTYGNAELKWCGLFFFMMASMLEMCLVN